MMGALSPKHTPCGDRSGAKRGTVQGAAGTYNSGEASHEGDDLWLPLSVGTRRSQVDRKDNLGVR